METMAEELGFKFTDVEVGPEMALSRTEDGEVDFENADVEKMRRLLEDNMSFLSVDNDSEGEEDPPGGVIDVEFDGEDESDDEDEEGAFQ